MRPMPVSKARLPSASGQYLVNEIFHTLQGEGSRAGTGMVFVRFARCNLKCTVKSAGFDCDTEFETGKIMTAAEIVQAVDDVGPLSRWVLFTGGEPALQLDRRLIREVKDSGRLTAIETNGTVEIHHLPINHVTVSPKTSDKHVLHKRAHDLKFVLRDGQAVPPSSVMADRVFVSPAFKGLEMDPKAVAWCVALVKSNPRLSLSLQTHKWIGIE